GDGSQKAKWLGDYGKDKVSERLRDVEQFLLALHKSQPYDSAGSDCDQRLEHVKTRALRIGPGIHKGEHALSAKAYVKEQIVKSGQAGEHTVAEILQLHAGDEQHGCRRRHADQSRSEIGLLHNQQRKKEARQNRGQKRVPPIVDGLCTAFEKESQEQDQRRLRQL